MITTKMERMSRSRSAQTEPRAWAFGRATYLAKISLFNERSRRQFSTAVDQDLLRHDSAKVGEKWAPEYGCDVGEPVPCAVAELFAGTTAMVAYRLGRHGVGVKLNEIYIPIGKHRVARPGEAGEGSAAQALPAEGGGD